MVRGEFVNLDQGLLNGRHHPERTRTTGAEVMNLKAHLLRHRRLVSPASGRRSSSPVLPVLVSEPAGETVGVDSALKHLASCHATTFVLGGSGAENDRKFMLSLKPRSDG
jgi:hypothetical protein